MVGCGAVRARAVHLCESLMCKCLLLEGEVLWSGSNSDDRLFMQAVPYAVTQLSLSCSLICWY
jgi:hypothetical protein